jgi:hypothetical protein
MYTHLGTWNVGLKENIRTRIRINPVSDMGGAKSAVRYTVQYSPHWEREGHPSTKGKIFHIQENHINSGGSRVE